MNTHRKKPQKIRPRQHRPGDAPGNIVVDPSWPRPEIDVIAYSDKELIEANVESVKKAGEFLGKWPVIWINVCGLGDEAVLRQFGAIFGIHRLVLEDIVNVKHRAKVEDYGDRLFLVLRMVRLLQAQVDTEQISIILSDRVVLTFQERRGDCFDGIRERIRRANGRIRTAGADYLAYAVIDAVIDGYFPILEQLGEQVDVLEQQLLATPTPQTLHEIHNVKKDLVDLRRAIWPKREAISKLTHDPFSMITDETRIYLRDCYDHTIQIIDLAENQRETMSGLTDLYMSSIGQKTNEIMKVLAIISTIFIPLSFVAGLYGMNFDTHRSAWNMPELGLRFGYPAVIGVMGMIAVAQLIFFKRKGWLGGPRRP